MQAIDSHAKLINLEITSNPNAMHSSAQPQLPDSIVQPPMYVTPIQPDLL